MKKTLLIAAAALAAGVISTQAQPVYSQNIVGYANIATPSAGVNYLISVPFAVGSSNGANEVFPNLPEFSQIFIWSPTQSRYSIVQRDTGSSTGWSDPDYNEVPVPVLPVGQGFFLQPSSALVTNTIVGSVAIAAGTSNVMTFPSAGVNYLVGCVVPYAGAVTNGTSSGGGPNLNDLPEFSQLLIWDSTLSKYSIVQTDTGSSTGWSDPDYNEVPVPSITVGEGFFIQPSAPNAKWTTGL